MSEKKTEYDPYRLGEWHGLQSHHFMIWTADDSVGWFVFSENISLKKGGDAGELKGHLERLISELTQIHGWISKNERKAQTSADRD